MSTQLALIIVMIIITMVAIFAIYKLGKCRAKSGFLIYPYLDLDEPGERGQYYELSKC